MLDTADVLAIHTLVALYGHIIDERQWSRLDELFTADVTYEAGDFDLPTVHSLADLRALWTDPSARHPLAHHATNVVVSEDADGTVRVLSKGIGVGYGGRVGSVVYRDEIRLTPAGWRIAARSVTLRRPPSAPSPPRSG